ncbi:hydro-lyase, Fe-S type, tartrate/fumarate subfamily, alpha subunit [Desulfofundulus kuznetsovii DSM 6115]|jgi:fumarate hydratase subunit alpha/L(+)-tartrate dehydratase alpha subunit|uniref:Hydro-lyase, Fe-S type, tartrate/fumarate subfamily, alpha subunit n=2 Tax=Desulfofundulus TaxID=2282741 RepID=A0AAU8PFE7_DESK7|nr:fumarate hydratase [Desulfofundulus luciae]AEG16740.1 hydro-lyase, Fe-S type, tartrate/fumarate subfamily, alpha subunit [Desulfofundulus kuznetsovii DSM 6115]MDQ0286176.1 fumarate hydratase subunit alpha/L(+)-tartrate dehydratase alpha subunit [Desulfofundulus luciae]
MTTASVNGELYSIVEDTAKSLYIKALKDLPPDVRQALQKAYETETEDTPKKVLSTMLEAIAISDDKQRLLCQDTGIPLYFVKVGSRLNIDIPRLQEAIVRGTERATVEHPLRSSVCHPIKRTNHQTSTGYRIPLINLDFVKDDDTLEILMVPKGSGSENMSFLKMLIPAEGIRGVKKFIIDSVLEAGANPCPPFVIGVGLGGTADLCVKLAKLAAVTRPLGSRNDDPDIAALEEELLEAVNQLGIGPMGLGGKTTALALNIEYAYTHITQNPVAVNIQCWPARRARAKIDAYGRVEFGY